MVVLRMIVRQPPYSIGDTECDGVGLFIDTGAQQKLHPAGIRDLANTSGVGCLYGTCMGETAAEVMGTSLFNRMADCLQHNLYPKQMANYSVITDRIRPLTGLTYPSGRGKNYPVQVCGHQR